MKRPDLIVLIAVWEFLTVAAGLIAIVAMGGMLLYGGFGGWGMMGGWWGYSSTMPNWMGSMMAAVMWMIALLLLAYLVLAVLGGIWILQGKEAGRIISLVHAAISLLWIPVGTVIGALIIVYLTRQNMIDYFQPPKPQA
ncbi:MAG: hypothetical protein PHR56_02510 [Dehalococcoidales bacterium]|nr:hypothetical protein [Dehalococcoidales bacterium]